MNGYEIMLKAIKEKKVEIAVMGLGYVGLPLALEFARAKYRVTGLDPDARKSEAISAGRSYITDVKSSDLGKAVKSGFLRATTDFSELRKTDVVFICVPTPFSKAKEPDVSYIIKASGSIAEHMVRKQLIILESTTYPGTTEEIVLPILENAGFRAGKDFYLVFSPERVDPGNKKFTIKNTPKVIGGLDPKSTELAKALYSQIISREHIVPVSNPRIAEMTKLLENTFRSVNIALINELTLLCDRMGIDIWEVIDAASSKPFGFMPFYPGPGVGGHCIPVDPYYLSWKAREYDFYTKFIELSAEINQGMSRYVTSKVGDALNEEGKSLKGAKILALGVAFKRDINDARNSPAIKVIEELAGKGAELDYSDPYIPDLGNGNAYFSVKTGLGRKKSVRITAKALAGYDAVVILVDHSDFNFPFIVRNSKLIVDAKNACKKIRVKNGGKIIKI